MLCLCKLNLGLPFVLLIAKILEKVNRAKLHASIISKLDYKHWRFQKYYGSVSIMTQHKGGEYG